MKNVRLVMLAHSWEDVILFQLAGQLGGAKLLKYQKTLINSVK